MKNRFAAIAAVALAATVTLAGCAGADELTSATPTPNQPAATAAAFNDADVMFTTMMIEHHAQAIEMSDIILAKDDVNPQVGDLAQTIKDAQAPEIEQLQGWRDEWGVAPGDHDMGDMGHGDGMMTAEDLAALEAADGPEASKLFLEQMIVHHEGAVDMAREQIDNGQHAGAIDLAHAITDAQTTEIQTMRDILTTL